MDLAVTANKLRPMMVGPLALFAIAVVGNWFSLSVFHHF